MTKPITDGVNLVPATTALLALEDVSAVELSKAMNVAPPPSWPPLYNGPETRNWVRERISADPTAATWYTWYIIADIDGSETLAGIAGYKGPPTTDGSVEIGYSVAPELQRRGIASAAVAQLCRRAWDHGATAVMAHTLPDLVPSQGVLSKSGFQRIEVLNDPEDGEVWRYRLARP